jgi:hypothetical protein
MQPIREDQQDGSGVSAQNSRQATKQIDPTRKTPVATASTLATARPRCTPKMIKTNTAKMTPSGNSQVHGHGSCRRDR